MKINVSLEVVPGMIFQKRGGTELCLVVSEEGVLWVVNLIHSMVKTKLSFDTFAEEYVFVGGLWEMLEWRTGAQSRMEFISNLKNE